MTNLSLKQLNKANRRRRSRAKVRQFTDRPRLVVFRSNRAIEASLIDDLTGRTLTTVSSRNLTETKAKTKSLPPVEQAKQAGQVLAERAKQLKITAVTFDRSGYRYHGQVKALAEGARQAGLQF